MGATCLHRYTCCIHESLNAAMHWAVMLIEYADALQRMLRLSAVAGHCFWPELHATIPYSPCLHSLFGALTVSALCR